MAIALRLLLLTVFLLLTMAGCASLFSTSEPATKAPPHVMSPEPVNPVPPVSREPGAIWSENSRWNDFYSSPSGRASGDLILVKPTDAFRATVAARSAKANSGSDSSLPIGKENSYLVVAIKEVLPHNTYSVMAHQTIKVGSKEQELTLQGKLREQDIGPDDAISSDLIFDMAVDIKVPDPEPSPKLAANSAVPESEPKKGKSEEPGTSKGEPQK